MGFDQFFRNVEPKAGTAAVFVSQFPEAFENVHDPRRWNAGVFYREKNIVVLQIGADADAPAFCCVFCGVADEICQYLNRKA